MMVAAVCVLAMPIDARQDDARIAAAEAAAKSWSATPEGRQFGEAIGGAFGREHSKTVGACVKSTPRPSLANFSLLLRVNAAGVVEEALVTPGTNVSTCVQGKLAQWKAATPPRAGWVKVNVNLTRK